MLWIALAAPSPGDIPSTPDLAPDTNPLQTIAWWALQFTPRVCEVDGRVLLEVQDSLRLFGGGKALLERVRDQGPQFGLIAMGVAPTALAALALLNHSLAPRHTAASPTGAAPVAVAAASARQFSTILDTLPLATLPVTQPHIPTLQRLGCNTLGQLRSLPRGGLARRFGAALLDGLDQAYGLRPSSFAWLELPQQFDSRIELPGRIVVAEGLLFAARRLLGQMALWLRARALGVTCWALYWDYDRVRRGATTCGELLLRTAQATRDTSHLSRLTAEYLAKTLLEAPVVSVGLKAVQTEPLAPPTASFLPDAQCQGESILQLIERLSARLGPVQVLHGNARADQRPQHMQQWHPAVNGSLLPRPGQPPRQLALFPPWILAQPLRLAVQNDRPLYQGPLVLLAGPLRIETGWWSLLEQAETEGEELTLRDYHVAWSAYAGLLWIYRRRSQGEPAWYLHGIYG